MSWAFPRTELDQITTLIRPAAEKRITWAQILEEWQHERFAIEFSRALAAQPNRAFRWECPPLTTACTDEPVEFVLVDSPSLERSAEIRPFSGHFNGDAVVTFTNLGGDATLVVPAEVERSAEYAHLASFLRTAPESQHAALWAAVSQATTDRLSTKPLWLSTAGGGVPWLHVRLDDRPKYYAHAPYRSSDG